MNINRTTVGSVVLTLLLVTSAVPFGMVDTASADPGVDWYTISQPGGVCHEVQAFPADYPKMQPHVRVMGSNEEGAVTGPYEDPGWSGPTTIESIMDYRYRDEDKGQTSYYAPYLNSQYRYEPWQYGTYGLWNWSVNGESHMFFYENANGEVSLVIRHDKIDDTTGIGSHAPYNGMYGDTYEGFMHGDQSEGGRVTFRFDDLPQGEWAYIDDMYPREDMDDEYYDADGVRYGHREAEYESQPLREFTGGDFQIHWFWGNGGTDGGAYRGLERLEGNDRIVIDPSFSNIDAWRVRHNDGSVGDSRFSSPEDGEMLDLQIDQPVYIEEGQKCLSSTELSASPDQTEANDTVTFDAGADRAGVTYRWDFDGDGTYDVNTTGDARVTHQYTESGTYEASVRLEEDGQTTEDTVTVEIAENAPPTARIGDVTDNDGLPDRHVQGDQLVFNGSASSDNGQIVEYVWQFGNETRSGETVTFRYDEPGTKEVSLTVTDGVGNTDTVTTTVEIEEPDEQAPSASLDVSPIEFEAGRSVELDASGSSDDNGIATYHWDLNGDGQYEESGTSATLTDQLPYTANGSYSVSVEVEDGNGNTANESVPITVSPAEAPTIGNVTVDGESPDGASVTAGNEFELAVEASDNVGVSQYGWDFDGDGQVDQTTGDATVTYSYGESAVGQQRITVYAYDDANHETARQLTVRVNPGPVASISANATNVSAGDTVQFDASGSTAQGSSITEYRWDFDGDGQTDETTTDATVSHSYGSGDEYDATVTIVTEDGNEDDASVSVVVTEEQGLGDGDNDDDKGGFVGVPGGGGGSGGGGGGGGGAPPSVVTEVESVSDDGALVDVRNGQGDEAVRASLPESAVATETGVAFTNLVIDLGGDDPHVVFETAASADAPESVAAPSGPDETMSYLDVSGEYLDKPVDSTRVIFTVEKARLGDTYAPEDISLYHYDDESWERLNTTVARDLGDSYRLKATTDSLGTFAVGATQTLTVSDADLGATTATEGETVEATATLTNDGPTDRTLAVNLTFDGKSVAAKSLTVPAGESRDVTVAADVGEPGTYDVAIEGAPVGSLTVEGQQATGPADISTNAVSMNTSTISAGEYVEITATVENTGGEAGTHEVALTMFGEQVATKTVEVPGGETKTVTFVQRVDSPGEYTVKVDGKQASLSVQSAQDDGPVAPSVPGFGIGTAVVALVAAALLARRYTV